MRKIKENFKQKCILCLLNLDSRFATQFKHFVRLHANLELKKKYIQGKRTITDFKNYSANV